MSIKINQVGKYKITSKIAEGGMGAIYKAIHPTLNRDVILKRLTLVKSSGITERFKREAQLMIDFRHHNIVQVYDHFKEGNSYFIVMEYVDGVTLSELIEKKRYIPNDIAVLIFTEICKALKYAHDQDVIHRDIKPDNVLISKDGEVKLTDFGIATSKDDDEDGLTSAGMTLGTPAYMSPEQIADSRNVDKRADIYSMGVLLYKMVTGKTPFPGSFTPEAVALINKGEYLSPIKINPRVSPFIQKVIKKSMHHKAKKRYKDLSYILTIFSKQLKKFKDQNTINNHIKSYIFNKEAKDSDKQPSGKKGKLFASFDRVLSTSLSKVLLSIFIIVLLLAGISYYFYYNGYHYEYFMADEYGALKLEVKVMKSYIKPDEIYTRVYLLRKVNKRFLETGCRINLKPAKNRNEKEYYYLITDRMYLKSDFYRIQINIGNEVYQQDFFLSPRVIQKYTEDSGDGKKIAFSYKTVSHLPLMIYYTVNDSANGNDISQQCKFFIKYRNKWEEWDKFIRIKNYQNFLVTGRTHNFRFDAEGYYTQVNRVYLKPNQTVLELAVAMTPVPGSLLIRSNYAGMDILLNNSSTYYSGGRYRKILDIDHTNNQDQTLILSPGNYFLTAKESASVSATEQILIEAGKAVTVNINYDITGKAISINLE